MAPALDHVGVNISLNNSSLLSFLKVYAPPICSSLTDSRTNSFSLSIHPLPEISSFWGISIAIISSGTPKVLLTPVKRKYSIRSSFQTFFPLNHPDTPTLLRHSSGSCSSPSIYFAPSCLAKYIIFSALSLILPHLPPPLTFSTVLPKSKHRSMPTAWISHLFSSQRPCVAKPGPTCPSSVGLHDLRSLIHLSAPPFTGFLVAATDLFLFTATYFLFTTDNVVYSMLKHLPGCNLDFLHVFNFLLSFLFYHLEDIFYYSHPYDGKAS